MTLSKHLLNNGLMPMKALLQKVQATALSIYCVLTSRVSRLSIPTTLLAENTWIMTRCNKTATCKQMVCLALCVYHVLTKILKAITFNSIAIAIALKAAVTMTFKEIMTILTGPLQAMAMEAAVVTAIFAPQQRLALLQLLKMRQPSTFA